MSESETKPKTEPEKEEEPTKTVSDEKAAEGEEEIGKIKYFIGRKCFEMLHNHWVSTTECHFNGWHQEFVFLDIDLNDPEVEAAAAKIQSAFKNRKGFGKKWTSP